MASSILPVAAPEPAFNPSDPVALVIASIGFLSLFLNGFVLATFWKNPSLRSNGSTALLLNIVAADLGLSIFGCPFAALAAFHGEWIFGEVGCLLYGFQGMLFGLASIMSLASLQIDRYINICQSPHTLLPSLGGHRSLLTAIIWTNAAFWASAPVYGWHRYGLEPLGTSCTIDYQHNSSAYLSYIGGVFCLSYVAPLGAMLFCEFEIRKRLHKLHTAESEARLKLEEVKEGEGEEEKLEKEKEEKLFREDLQENGGSSLTSIGLLSVFLVCWTPYAIVCIWAAVDGTSRLPATWTALPPIFAKAAAILNPCVYLTLAEVRRCVAKMFGVTIEKGKTRGSWKNQKNL